MGLKLSKAAASIPARVQDNILQIIDPRNGKELYSVKLPFKGIILNSGIDYDNPTMPDVWLKVSVEFVDAEFNKPISGVLIYNSYDQLVLYTKSFFVYSIVDMPYKELFAGIRILRFGSIEYIPAKVFKERLYQAYLTCFTTSKVAFISFAGGEIYYYLVITEKNKDRIFYLCNCVTVSYPVWEWQSFGIIEKGTGERLDCVALERSGSFDPYRVPLFSMITKNTIHHAYRTAPGTPLKFASINGTYNDEIIEDDGTRETLVRIYRNISGIRNASGYAPIGAYHSAYYNLIMQMMSDPLLMAGSVLSSDYMRLVKLGGDLYGSSVIEPNDSIYAQNSESTRVSKLDQVYVSVSNAYELFKSTREKVIVPEPYATVGSKARIPFLSEDLAQRFPYFKTKQEFREYIRKEDSLYEYCGKR